MVAAVGVSVVLVLALLFPNLLFPRSCPSQTETPVGPTSSGFPSPIRHVFVVLLENAGAGAVLQQGPYERYLAHRYAYAQNYFGVGHPSAPNYLAVTSGQAWQCGSDAYNVYSTRNLADVVEGAGQTWSAYLEDMPGPCYTADSGNYRVHHNPFVYYSDVVSNTSRCAMHDVNFTAWQNDVQSQTLPSFGLIVPNNLHDGHDTGVAAADSWLGGWLSPLLNDSFFNSSVFFIVYDESSGSDAGGFNGTWGGNVYLAAVSPSARSGLSYLPDVTHYNLLTTIEWLLGLGTCGHWDNATQFPPMEGLFTFGPATAGPSP